ncbi:MAG: hypothetical protein GF309_14590 [Candidatus Lokiarchaeota archaeon]|nr:hypothetical protein [Candidatus Lokiarchaeota archaeon]
MGGGLQPVTVREKIRERKEEEAKKTTVKEKEQETTESSQVLDKKTEKQQKETVRGQSRKEQEIKVSEQIQVLRTFMPEWGSSEQSPWMYFVPATEEGIRKWTKEWHDFLIEWAYHNKQHVFSFSTFIREPPYCEMRNKREAFSEIAETMVQQGLAEWIDEQRKKLRLIWKSKIEMADDLYQWALERGTRYLDLRSLVIQEEFDFGGLPQEIIRDILELIVQTGRAEWVDKERATIKVKI